MPRIELEHEREEIQRHRLEEPSLGGQALCPSPVPGCVSLLYRLREA
jgi:hypothetical protein